MFNCIIMLMLLGNGKTEGCSEQEWGPRGSKIQKRLGDKQPEYGLPFISSWYMLISTDCLVLKKLSYSILWYFGHVQNSIQIKKKPLIKSTKETVTMLP